MPIYSMTGFSKAVGQFGSTGFVVEMRSVNGKSLDMRLRTPSGLETLEEGVRALLKSHLDRGNLQINISLERTEASVEPTLNEDMLLKLHKLAGEAAEKTGLAPLSLESLFAMKGVLEWKDHSETAEEAEELTKAILQTVETAIYELKQARQNEGARLEEMILSNLSDIATLTEKARTLAATAPEALKERLLQTVDPLLNAQNGRLDKERLEQEVAVLAAKADVREELDRLLSHVTEGRAILKAGSPAGRKLDFLSQEFNREANTLCSKSSSAELTKIGLALKLVVDQMREQVQNIE